MNLNIKMLESNAIISCFFNPTDRHKETDYGAIHI